MYIKHATRLSAAGLHFLLSLTLFSLFLFVLIKLWYPQPYFSSSGGWQGLKIVALVDLVLGPLITLIIYNTNKPKKTLLLDLAAIISLQLCALSYGIYTVYSQRPVAIAFWEDKFYTIPAEAFKQQSIDLEKLQTLSKQNPAIIYVDKPITVDGIEAMVKVVQEQRIPPTQQFNLYRSIDSSSYKQNILKHSININEVITANTDMAAQLKTVLAETQTTQSENFYIALESKYQNIILVLNADAEQIGFLKAPYKTDP